MNIIESILTQNPCYKAGVKINVKGLMLHSVGCPQPSASVFVRNWNTVEHNWSCVHAFIDANTGDVYKCLPWNHRGWHGGGTSNNTHIGVEMCEPDCIKYVGGATFTCSDVNRAKAMAERTYKSAVELFAKLCKDYNLNPLGDGVIISHSEGSKRGIASAHADPEHLWNQLGMSYTMDTFRNAVSEELRKLNGVVNTPVNTTPVQPQTNNNTEVLYRVQVGAFKNLDNAKRLGETLRGLGVGTYLIEKDGFYKVQIGAFKNLDNAEALKEEMERKGYACFITKNAGNAVH